MTDLEGEDVNAFRVKYKQEVDESDSQKIRYEEGSWRMKDVLASQGLEVLNLKKQLSTTEGQ